MNGEFLEEEEVRVSPWDLGFLRGYGVFDYFAVYHGKPFMVEAHFRRLINSARAIALSSKLSREQFLKIVEKLIEENNLENGAIRIILTGGVSKNGITKGDSPTLIIRPEKTSPIDQERYKHGSKLITTNYMRDFPEAKTIHYIEAIKHEEEMRSAGAIEILFVSGGIISECSRSNIFVVSKGTLLTPKERILKGITRGVVLEEARKLKIKTEERDVSLSEAFSADEVFISGTGKKIMPIVEIDGRIIASGIPGEITSKLLSAYVERTKQ